MGYRDLQEFIAALEQAGELHRIKVQVSSELEITEITDRISKQRGPALLFENVQGSEFPVLMNAFGSPARMALALQADDLDQVGADIEGLIRKLEELPGGSWMERIKSLSQFMPLARLAPRVVSRGACQEIVHMEPDLSILPILKCWPEDGGRFITLPQVYTHNPVNGRRNVGMYRLQVYDKQTTGMHWHIHHDGAANYQQAQSQGDKRMEVAVALGGDPAITYAATAPLPKDIDELLLAGFLRKQPVELVKCRTIDVQVPAAADFVLEGYVNIDEKRTEGPFGDHTGYYSLPGEFPVFHLTAVTHKRQAVYPATIVGRPPQEDCYIALATERIFLPLLKLQLPEIVDMHMPVEGVFHNCVFVSIRKSFPYHARKVMNALWGMGQMMFAKFIFVLDADVNVQDTSEVMWRVFNNVDPQRDTMIVEGPLEVLDHSAPHALFGSKMGIDATRKLVSEGHPREWPHDIAMTPEIKTQVERRWAEYGFK